MPLTDAEAKAKLAAWPTVTGIWTRPDDTTRWLRAQPPVAGVVGPRLEVPGAGAFRTQPDGLWVTLGIRPSDTDAVATFADCIAIESCGTSQNFSDKRSRYAARTTALVVRLPAPWLAGSVIVQSGAVRTRRQVLRGRLPDGDITLPLRHLRVLYALPNDNGAGSLFARVSQSMALDAHEFVCPQNVLGSYTGQPMQRFLKRMGPEQARYP